MANKAFVSASTNASLEYYCKTMQHAKKSTFSKVEKCSFELIGSLTGRHFLLLHVASSMCQRVTLILCTLLSQC